MKFVLMAIALLVSYSTFASQLEVATTDGLGPEGQQHISYNFGTVWLPSRTSAYFNVTNTGTTPLTFKRAVISGGSFEAYHSCKNGLQPQQKCSFEIVYWPAFEGMNSGRFVLSFVEDDHIIVDLWGNARRMP